jgi:RNA:NAD 2'-phosphotransferase (TPT1/KptA family)
MRHWMNLIEATRAAIPDCFGPCLYHATFRRFLPAIMQHGLGATPERRNFDISRSGAVYLTNHPDAARSYAEDAADQNVDSDDIVILEVDQTKLDTALLYVDANDTGVMLAHRGNNGDDNNAYLSYAYHGVIPPAALSQY